MLLRENFFFIRVSWKHVCRCSIHANAEAFHTNLIEIRWSANKMLSLCIIMYLKVAARFRHFDIDT